MAVCTCSFDYLIISRGIELISPPTSSLLGLIKGGWGNQSERLIVCELPSFDVIADPSALHWRSNPTRKQWLRKSIHWRPSIPGDVLNVAKAQSLALLLLLLLSLHEFRTHSTSWWLGISAQGICIPAVAVGTLPRDRIAREG
jgi:hypothetical protein